MVIGDNLDFQFNMNDV